MLFDNDSGVLLHPTSLPGPHGVGDFGMDAYRFIDCLERGRQSLWQVLPLTPPGNAASPYQSESSFAGDPLLISLDLLEEEGLIVTGGEIAKGDDNFYEHRAVRAHKLPRLRAAAAHLLADQGSALYGRFEAFCAQQAAWLEDYARFCALKSHFAGAPWFSWPADIVARAADALTRIDRELEGEIAVEKAIQFFFEDQWRRLRRYANDRGIRVVGDVPIFVAHDSADTWANQSLFLLDSHGQPTCVAGVPPDYFSKEGQRWGNPLFAWDKHVESDFLWWRSRISRTLELTDVLRIDHFRGLAACWEIPIEEKTAIVGRWVEAPGALLLEFLQKDLGDSLPIIAEDLGIITDDVVALRESFHLPTMRILQFSFNGEERFLPHLYPKNCVAYTGTHDNDTIVGWYTYTPDSQEQMTPAEVEAERDQLRRYYATDGTNIQWTCMKGLLGCPAAAVIFPLQDVLGLGSEARMNTPGTVGDHNWTWRFTWSQVHDEMIDGLAEITRQTGRNAR